MVRKVCLVSKNCCCFFLFFFITNILIDKDLAEAVFFGINTVLPMVTREMLKVDVFFCFFHEYDFPSIISPLTFYGGKKVSSTLPRLSMPCW